MDPTITAIAVFVAVLAGSLFILLKAAPSDEQKHKRKLLQNLDVHPGGTSVTEDVSSILRGDNDKNVMNRALRYLPGMQEAYTLTIKTGEVKPNLLLHLVRMLVVLAVTLGLAQYFNYNALLLIPYTLIIAFTASMPAIMTVVIALILGYSLSLTLLPFIVSTLLLSYYLPRKLLLSRVDKRNREFLDIFPDAMDMIVRSVRAGHPLSASLRMIAENVDPPVSTEFKQVIDEISYGRTMAEALARMADRIDQPDLNYFVVVLSVQQETGGNLSEVLSNLSDIIRKRKLLRLKIRALTAEARATGWVLGLMPIIVFAIIYWMSPGYLTPLLTTPLGNAILGAAGGLVMLGAWIVNRMIQVKI